MKIIVTLAMDVPEEFASEDIDAGGIAQRSADVLAVISNAPVTLRDFEVED